MTTDSYVTVAGNLTADPVVGSTKSGDVFTSFRVAVNHGYFDRERGQWLETGASFYKVSCFRALAVNAFESLKRGTPVLVQGRLKVVDWVNGDKRGTEAQIKATAIGPNLVFGQAEYTSVRRPHFAGEDQMADENVRSALADQPVEEAATDGEPGGAESFEEDPYAEGDYEEEQVAEEPVAISA